MKKFPWLMLIVFLVVLVVAFAVALPFFARSMGIAGVRGYGFMPWHMGSWGMMGAMPFFGGLWMIVLLLVPLAILALAVVGVVSLIRRARQP
jgi:hypothetical protein